MHSASDHAHSAGDRLHAPGARVRTGGAHVGTGRTHVCTGERHMRTGDVCLLLTQVSSAESRGPAARVDSVSVLRRAVAQCFAARRLSVATIDAVAEVLSVLPHELETRTQTVTGWVIWMN